LPLLVLPSRQQISGYRCNGDVFPTEVFPTDSLRWAGNQGFDPASKGRSEWHLLDVAT
jgi:hypothetical protein